MRKPLQYEDAVAIRQYCPDVEEVAVDIFYNGPAPGAKYKGQEMLDAGLQGASAEDFSINGSTFVDGRPYTELEDTHRLNVAVIGADITERFFQGEDRSAKNIIVGGNTFRIIGALGKRLSFLGDNGSDRTVYIPYWTFRKILPRCQRESDPGQGLPQPHECSDGRNHRRHAENAQSQARPG